MPCDPSSSWTAGRMWLVGVIRCLDPATALAGNLVYPQGARVSGSTCGESSAAHCHMLRTGR